MHTVSVFVRHGDHQLHLTGTYIPGCPGTWSEWDGGTPPESPEIEDMEIFVRRGERERLAKVSDALFEEIYDEAMEALDD